MHPSVAYDRMISIQRRIAAKVLLEDRYSTGEVAGVDQAFPSGTRLSDPVVSGAVLLSSQGVVRSRCFTNARIPYVPGLLFFREGPAALRALRGLGIRPTLLFVDGCGINQPRGAGMASMLGVILDVPTIGISKSPLCGEFDLPDVVGEAQPLTFKGRHVGYVYKSKRGCRPIFVAPGHLVSVDDSLKLAREYTKEHKLPIPCVLAHRYANEVKKEVEMEAGKR